MTDSEQPGNWQNRRRIIYLTLAFCACIIGYIVGFGEDTRVNETAVTFAFLTGSAVVGSYVFGAAWEMGRAPSSRSNPKRP